MQQLKRAALLLLPTLLLAACGPGSPEVAAVQQSIMRDVANAGGLGTRENLTVAAFVEDEFAAVKPTIAWASVPPKKDSADAGLVNVTALITSGEAGFPKVTLRFKYDPATKKVTYRDMLVGKKPYLGKNGSKIALGTTYETIKTEVQAKALAKAEAKAKKKAAEDKKKKKQQESSEAGDT